MPFDPLTHWLALSKSSLSALGQMTNAACAGLAAGPAAPLPQTQAHFAHFVKSALAVSQQWRDTQSAALTALLKTQMAGLDTARTFATLQDFMELQHSLAGDLAAQRMALLKAINARGATCIGDLANTANEDDVTIVLGGLMGDVLAQVKDNLAESFTLVNSAQAAATVLTHQALDRMIVGARPE